MDDMHNDSARLLRKLERIKTRLHDETALYSLASNDVINTVAVSSEIANDLKEVLILLHTTMVTELTEAKIANYKINIDIVGAAEEMISLQSIIINRLATMDAVDTKPKTNKSTAFLKLYKTPVSLLMVVCVLWIMSVIDAQAMQSVFDALPELIKRFTHA